MIVTRKKGKVLKTGFAVCSILFLTVTAAAGADVPAKQDPGEWKKVLDAAKREGKLVMSGDPSEFYRKVLVGLFEKKYPDIKVEYSGINGRDFRPKLAQERKVGQYLWDLRISGVNPESYDMKDEGYFDPARPFALPEIADDSKWHGGFGYMFSDKEKKYFPTIVYHAEYRAWINRDFLAEAQLNSSKQLLDPQFKGKMSIQNPISAAGSAAVAQMYVRYGENFVRDLFQKQGIVVTSDKRQQVEWLARGRYPIALGLEHGFLLEFKKRGVGLNIKAADKSMDDAIRVIQLVNKAPHPNAFKVYLNWILSEEGQREVITGLQGISMRKDVAPFEKDQVLDPLAETHRRMYEEKADIREKVNKLVAELIK